jgi:hypothetical protein
MGYENLEVASLKALEKALTAYLESNVKKDSKIKQGAGDELKRIKAELAMYDIVEEKA